MLGEGEQQGKKKSEDKAEEGDSMEEMSWRRDTRQIQPQIVVEQHKQWPIFSMGSVQVRGGGT